MNCKKLRKTGAVFAFLLLLMSFTDSVWGQTVSLVSVDNITTNSMRVQVSATGTNLREFGFVYSRTNDAPTINNNEGRVSLGNVQGTYDGVMRNLIPNTTYYVRAYATNNWNQTQYDGSTAGVPYTTLIEVTTVEVTDITSFNALGRGSLTTNNGNAPITARGICWSSTNSSPIINGSGCNHAASNTEDNPYSVEMTNLQPNTTYYMRAYAQNSGGAGYGAVVTFTTPAAPPVVTTVGAIHVTSVYAVGLGRVNDECGSPVTRRGVCWSTTNTTPTIDGSGCSYGTSGTGIGNYSVEMNDLQPNTTYYVRAFAENGVGIAYGEVKTLYTTVHMQNGTIVVDDEFVFTDSEADDGWYNHNEDYTLVFIPESTSNGVKIEFESLLINNDYLYFYDGDISDNNLIGVFTCNEYHAYQHNGDSQISVFGLNGNIFTVTSHNYMTVRFVSDHQWKDAGWVAHVSQVPFTPQPPAVAKLACTDDIFELLPTSKGKHSTTLKYAIAYGGENPGEPNTEYSVGTPININGSYPVKIRVKTEVVESVGADTLSSVSRLFTFGDESLVGHPVAPTITPPASGTSSVTLSVVRPADLNDTWKILYTLDGTDPADPANTNVYTIDATSEDPGTHDVTTSGTVALYDFCEVIAVVQGTTCPDIYSDATSYIYDDTHTIYLVPPTISFAGNGSTASTTIIPPTEGCIIYYTVNDGPTQIYASPAIDDNPAIAPTPFMVNANDRVKAWVDKPGSNYVVSGPAISTYLPGNDNPGSGSGLYGDVVYLDDREPHSWSYYSDGDQPVHSLHPADVKITYFGNGTGTVSTTNGPTPDTVSWTANATGVQVGPGAAGNQFVYYKTLEAGGYEVDNGVYINLIPDYEGTSHDYPYSLIPNPFSVRPMYTSVTTTRNIYVRGTIQDNAFGYINVTYIDANNTQQTWNGYINWSEQQGSIYPEANLQVLTGTQVSFSLYTSNGGFNDDPNSHVGCEVRYDDANGVVIWNEIAYWQNNNQNNPVTGSVTVQEGGPGGGPTITNTDYRGFYAWRVKRLKGVTIRDAYGTTYGENSIIDAETRLLFHTENEYDNEVDFEALWAKAYVVENVNTASGLNANVSYERNFVVGATTINGALNVPVTYSSYYPNGTVATNGNVNLVGNFICNNDTKFEYMNLRLVNNNGQGSEAIEIAANNHYLCLGRGINNAANNTINRVEGIPAQDQTDLRYTLRIESGKINRLSFVRDNDYRQTISGRYLVKGITGCDYDRAQNDNDNLIIACNPNIAYNYQDVNNRMFLSYGMDFTGRSNYDRQTFDLVVKSGTYQQPYWDNGGNGMHSRTYYVGQNNAGATISGFRYITVEGGEMGSMNGGRGTNSGSNTSISNVVSSIRVKGGTFHGSVFGGAADNTTYGSRRIVITDGEILGWIAGGCNGSGGSEETGQANTNGDSYIYVGGNASVGGDNVITVNTTPGGNVFGAGRGKVIADGPGPNNVQARFNQTAYVNTSNVVVADDAYVSNNVYGGGYHGYVTDSTNVFIVGGRVGNSVFGGAYMHYYNDGYDRTIPATRVHIKNGHVIGNVYGGSDSLGYVGQRDARVEMIGGIVGDTLNNLVKGSVFGGGNGIETAVQSNTFVTIDGGMIVNNVYGGGNMGKVYEKATVTIKNGKVGDEHSQTNPRKGNVYGGGRGEPWRGEVSYVNEAEVNIDGAYIMGSVFGGGENGHVRTNTVVNVDKGQVGGYEDDAIHNCNNPYHGSVFGGGSGLELYSNNGQNVYHNQAGWVMGNSTVNIVDGAHVMRNVYGGSNVASVGQVEMNGNTPVTDGAGYFNPVPNTGLATVNISGGIIGTDGESSTLDYEGHPTMVSNGMVFGSSYGYAVIGQKDFAHVNSTHVMIAAGADIRGSVFGGGEDGIVLDSTFVEIIDGTIGMPITGEESALDAYGASVVGPIYKGNVYGGGRGLDLHNDTISTVAGFVKSNTHVVMTGGLVRHNVYGGGSLANVGFRNDPATGRAIVLVRGGQVGATGINNGNVFGSGRGMPATPGDDELMKYARLAFTNNTFVTIDGVGKVKNAVFGGGENGHVFNKTKVNIDGNAAIGSDNINPYSGTMFGDVYGGGRGVDKNSNGDFSRTAGKVYVQTEVNVNNGTIYHAVYGGGAMASVGQIETSDGTPTGTPYYYSYDDATQTNDPETGYLKLKPTTTIENNGFTVVNINNGTIGSDGPNGDGNGNVFGSAKGWAGSQFKHLAYTGNTDVNIIGGHIMGSAFGGGENGHVLGSTDIEVSGGEIGLTGSHSTLMGNVFGGGCGTDTDENGKHSLTAGWVKFNTNTLVRGGSVYRNVYGGGNLASVGYAENHNAEFSGRANVLIKENAVIGIDGNENGHVFGSGYGRAATESGADTIYAQMAFVKNTFVTIQDDAEVKGSVFGSGENGHVRQNTHVFVEGGEIGTDGTTGYEGNVYGGGRGKDLNANNDYSRTSGRTYGNTFVDISGGKVNGSVFGGGRMATVGTYPAQDTIPADPDFNNGGETGRSTVYIHGGVTIGNENTALRGGNVYGGAKGLVGTKYAQLAYLKNTEVIIKETATINGSVFGGGENGHVSENTKVAIYNGTIGFAGGNEYKGNVFGGGRGIDRDANGNQTVTAGIVKGSTRVFFEGGTAYGSVFGGGNASLVSLEKVVNINGGDVMKNVFGGCKQVVGDTKVRLHPGTKTVNMRGGHVYGSVFGCSNNSIDGNFEEGHEKDWTAFVNISGGTIDGNVHGLGYAGEVIGSSEVNVGVNAIAEKVNGEWSDLSKRNVDNIYFDDRAYLPTVLTTGLFDVTDTSAEVDGYVSAIANSNVTERGICWGTSPEPTTKVQATTEGDGRGYYTLDLTGLTPSTTYYVRAYAINDKGTTYGAEISFTTDAAEPNYATAEIDRDEHEGKIEIENEVSIGNSVYAGSSYFGTQGNNVNDWTHYDATGYTNIYIDGTGYDTETEFDPTSDSGNSMNIGGGVFGSGTHCEAGLSGHNVLMREYGHRNVNTTDHGAEFTSGTRTLTTIQRCQNLLLDNVNINITGFNDINTTYNTNKLYSVVKVDDTLYMANASAIAIGAGQPAYMDSIFCVRSVHLNVTNRTIYDELDALEDDDLTNIENDSIKQNYGKIPSWEWIAVNPNTGSENTAQNARLYYRTSASTTPLNYTQENVILFNDFSQLWVRYHKGVPTTMYGELQGFFRMDSDYEPYGTESFAFARPKITGANNNNILSGNAENPYLYAKDNLEDGGFLSYKVDNLGGDYENGYNFFTEPGLIGGWNYPVDGDDGGEDFTKTKQYPYINVYPITRDDRDFYRMWVIPRRNGAAWYVDGRGVGAETGGWGKDLNHQDGWGHFPDKPKLTVSFKAGADDAHNGIIFDRTRTIPNPNGEGYVYGPYRVFDPSKDVIYVVGPVSALKEEDRSEININRVWENEYTLDPDSLYPLHNYKLKLFRYPGGHKMSNDSIDLSGTTTLLTQEILGSDTFEAYDGLPAGVTTGPGANYNAMIDVDSISDKQGNITLNNVLVDGLYGHTQIDDGFHQIPTSFNQDAVHKPLVVMGSGTTLTLKSVAEPDDPTQEGTELQRGYNNTKAAYYYDPDYDDDADDDPDNVFATRHGGAVYVHRYATMNAEGKVTVKENLQNLDQIVYDEDGEEAGTTPVKIESNVYLPTFKKHTYITGPLDQISRIGITSPIRNAEPHFTQNTMSPIAEATDADIAYNAWNNENYYDDLARFFYRGYQDDFKTTYYEQDAANYSPALADAGDDETIEKTLYFGWTWNNVVTRKPLDFSYDSIDSPEDLAWLISVVNGLNGRVANDLSSINVIEEKTDIDLVQYVWLPVGDQIAGVKPFGSKFDGRGHIITNLSMAYFGMGDGRYNRVNYGMFGAVDGGVVDRTFVLSGYIEPVSDLNHKGAANIGTLVGMLGTEGASKPKSMVSNSEGGADIVCAVRDDAFNVGSAIGYMVEGELHSSMGMSDIKAEKSYKEGGYIGGLVGRAEPNVDGKVANINNSFSNPKLMFGASSDVKAGGLVGYNVATIKNSYSRLQDKDDEDVPQAKFKLLAFETKMPIILGHSFQTPEYEQAGFDAGFASLLTNCYHYTDPMSADRYRYIYNDNKLQVKDGGSWKDIAEDETCLLFNNLNQWVEENNGEGHKYSLWVRPTITGINDDFPILHLCDWDDQSQQGLGDFRSMATWHGGPKLQYAGPVRDYNELNSMVDRMTTKDYMYVYGDVTDVLTARVDSANLYRPAKLSVYEHAAILHPGTLAGHPETYVGVTFDNSCAHAYSTPGLNHIEDSLFLPRDWHMFSSTLSNAPLGFNYDVNGVNTNLAEHYPVNPQGNAINNGTYYNNPWPYIDEVAGSTYGEFTWLNSGGNDINRYWMKGWENSQSQNCAAPEFDESKWVDGYFPSSVAGQSEFGDGCIEDEDEYGRFPYGMDMFCWYEPEPHWINFKRNGPNHWHSDEINPDVPHNQHVHKHLPYTEKNEDDTEDISNQNEDYLKIGKGYMFAIAKKTYLQSHGNLNAEEKYRAVTLLGKDFPGWNLVGNPYHAYLDFEQFLTKNGYVEPYYVIYDADGYKGGPKSAYLYYPNSGSEGGEYADPYLHPHQGFFIKTNNGNIPLTFDESMSVTRSDASDIAYRSRSYNYPLVNLYLSSERGCSDVTVIEFHRPSWGGAKKQKGLRQGNGLFYAYHENEPYAALFAKEGTDKVPLKFEAKEDDVFTMRWNTANGYFSSLYLIDNLTGARYDMLANDSYVFEGHKDDYYSRFYITFDCLDVEEYEEDEVEKTFAFFDGSQWVVTGEGTLELIDLQGRILWQERVSGGQSRVSIPDVAKSLYLLRLVNSSEGTKVQKIVID